MTAKNLTRAPYFIYRHKLPIRLIHWINVVCFIVLLMSGLNNFNAHPALNIGKSSYNNQAPILEMTAVQTNAGKLIGYTTIFGHQFNTTGFFGASLSADGRALQRGFPSWMTIPSSQWLSMARRWHLFFAWVFVINGITYVAYSLLTKHVQRDLLTTKSEDKIIKC